jgi:glutathione reductase (NADPH)
MGIDTPLTHINWEKLSNGIQSYISSESHLLVSLLKKQEIKHYNKYGYLIDSNEVALLNNWEELDSLINKNFETDEKITGDYLLLCTGERPVTKFENMDGLETAFTSDEIFKIKNRPRKALVLGGGFTAVEIASLLQGLGVDTNLYHRSEVLKNLDKELVDELVSKLKTEGAVFRNDLQGVTIKYNHEEKEVPSPKKGSNKLSLDGSYSVVSKFKNEEVLIEEYDLVVNSISRKTDLRYLDRIATKLKTSDSGKILGGFDGMMEKTSISNIFSAGDCLHKSPRNEPGAAIGGKRVANYIHADINNMIDKKSELAKFQFVNMPYCLFTDPEIAGFGLTQSKAELIYSEKYVKSISMKKMPYLEKLISMNPPEAEQELPDDNDEHKKGSKTQKISNAAKKIDDKSKSEGYPLNRYSKSNILKIIYETKSSKNKILGMHYLGEHAADIIQGYSVSYAKGMTLDDLKFSSNIHPCQAEDFIKLATIGENVAETAC